MNTKYIYYFVAIIIALGLAACKGPGRSADDFQSDIRYARNLKLEQHDGYCKAVIINPWDTTRVMATYYLVDKGDSLQPDVNMSDGTVLQVPLSRTIVYSNIHVSLIDELGKTDAIKGICDADYITNRNIKDSLVRGSVIDCGNNMSPVIERMMSINPDGILAAPMEDNPGHGKLSRIGIPLIEAADYLETTPLGRAEWMKFYGRLYGRGEQADSLFNKVEKEYRRLCDMASKVRNRPRILFDGVYGQIWNVPTSGSITGNLLTDAGGTNPFASLNQPGSAALSPEKVLYQAGDADIWLVRAFGPTIRNLSDWSAENKTYSTFKAFKNGNVYVADTSESGIFDDSAFHPQWILEDMISIIHPEIKGINPTKRYYKKLDS